MKKFLAMLLAMVMLLSCTAYAEAVNPDDIPDTMTSEDGKYAIAFVTDVGQLKDKSFNQGTWNGVKTYAAANGKAYKYYQPANGNEATDDDRYDAMKAAVEAGAEIIVCAGYMQGTALAKAAAEFTNVNFVFIDGWSLGMPNVAGVSFQEEQSGYLAGYAAVKEGFTKLGFTGGGGGTNAACDRFGYGFAQGANAAAKEMGIEVELRYSWQFGASFSASPDLQAMMSGWYETGTEVIFACGGSMFSSVLAAASANDKYVIGVDVDQSFEAPEVVVTSAMKGISEGAQLTLAAHFDGSWATTYGNNLTVLGAAQNAVGLPKDTWTMTGFTTEAYDAMFADMVAGTITVDNTDLQGDAITGIEFSNMKVIYE